MPNTLELNPEIAKQIIFDASSKGLPVETYLLQIISANNNEDAKIALMREVANDKLFLADLAETLEDFRHVDFE